MIKIRNIFVALRPAGYGLLIREVSRSKNKNPESKLMKYQEIIVKQTNIYKQSPNLENDSHLENEEISRLLWNPELHYLLLRKSMLVPVLKRINLFHMHSLYLPHPHIPPKPSSPKLFLPFRFSD